MISDLWNTPDGGMMGISMVSSTRLNLEEFPPIWNDIVHGFRVLGKEELAKIGRLKGSHRL